MDDVLFANKVSISKAAIIAFITLRNRVEMPGNVRQWRSNQDIDLVSEGVT